MNNKLEEYKELLSVLPRNNIKNSKKYYDKALGIKNEVVKYKEKLIEEIALRVSKIEAASVDEDYDEKLKTYKENLRIVNDYNDCYEKSYLDIILKNISKYYDKNLYKVNYDIYLAKKTFKNIGIDLSSEDFIFGKESHEYMKVFFEENDINSPRLKEIFDNLYWKSPNFILYICINFKHLYYKNIKKFRDYYQAKKTELYNGDSNQYIKDYYSFQKKHNEYINNSPFIIQNKFIDEKLDIKEFSNIKIDNLKKDLIIDEFYKDEENFINLEYTLKEYRYYIRYKYIVEEMIKIFKEGIGKKEIKNLLKSINKKEKKIISFNSKATHRGFFRKDNSHKYYIKINAILDELNLDYIKLEDLRFKKVIANNITDSSSYLDLLKIVNAFKNSLVNIIKKSNEEKLTSDELSEIEDFIYSPYNTIVNNLLILEEKDVLDVILDKYKLMNINLNEDTLKDNLDGFIKTVETINISNYIKNNNMEYDDLLFLVEAKKILNKKG